MFRVVYLKPQVEIGSTKTYSFFTGINVYTGLGIYGIGIGVLGFGIFFEWIKK